MSKIDFEKEINTILSQQEIFEEKLDVIIRDLKKYLTSRAKLVNKNDSRSERNPKKKVKFVYNKH
jgi:predicted nucleic-acid-binding protein